MSAVDPAGEAGPHPDWLTRLGRWEAVFDQPDFEFGRWEPSRQRTDGPWSMPYFVFSEAADQFLREVAGLGLIRPEYDWLSWQRTPDGQRLLRDPAAVAEATAEQLPRLLTVLVRADRFGEGTLADAHERGLLRAIVRRAATLAGG